MNMTKRKGSHKGQRNDWSLSFYPPSAASQRPGEIVNHVMTLDHGGEFDQGTTAKYGFPEAMFCSVIEAVRAAKREKANRK